MTDCVKASRRLVFDADAPDEGYACGIGPGAKFVESVAVDQEPNAATPTVNRLLAITSRFAQLKHVTERMARAFGELCDDRADVRT